MKRIVALLLLCALLFTGCGKKSNHDGIVLAATTKPVAEFTAAIASGTGIEIRLMVTENVGCLHDYTLTVRQMELLETADAVVISGCGLEAFMQDVLDRRDQVIDASQGMECSDPHIWLDPARAAKMAENIAGELSVLYPQYTGVFEENLTELKAAFTQLQTYAAEQTKHLTCRELVTFHDGFSCFAEALDMTVLAAMEEEHGSTVAAKDLIGIMQLVKSHRLPAIFTETNGSESAAKTVAAETGTKIFTLDMAMGEMDYFEAMYHNINTVKEAFS